MRTMMLAIAVLATAASPAPPLTADGWGALRIGMPEADLAREFGLSIPPDDEVNSFECREVPLPAGGPEASVMTEHGRVSRISVYGPSPLRTDRGFGIGSREADIQRAYGRGLKVEPHHYSGPEAHYLTYWTIPGRRGVRYETDDKGIVTAVHVGSAAIQYVESCL